MKFIFIFILLFISSCVDPKNVSELKAWTSVDPWYKPPSHSNWTQIDSIVTINIDSQKITNAETLLSENTFIHLKKDQIQTLVSEKYNDSDNLYLVRTVYLGDNRSGYSFYQNSDSLLIVNSSLGNKPKEMKHNSIIIKLPFRPKAVYSDCVMDE